MPHISILDWDSIETVLLDMDGTLLDLHFDNYFWQEYLPACWARKQALDLEAAYAILEPRFRTLEGTLSWYCLDFWTRELGLDVLALKDDVQHKIRLRPHAEVLLETLALLGKQCVLVTNAHHAVLEYKLVRTGIDRYFHSIHTAHSYGQPKEAPGFWNALEQQLVFDRRQALLIDDNLHVLKTARDYGIGHLLAITQPDSCMPPRHIEEFAAVEDFRDLFDGGLIERAAKSEISHPVSQA